jgi:hypothetical protein
VAASRLGTLRPGTRWFEPESADGEHRYLGSAHSNGVFKLKAMATGL